MASPSTTLRARKSPPKDSRSNGPSSKEQEEEEADPSISTQKEDRIRFSPLDILRVLVGLFLLSITLSYFLTGTSILWGYRPAYTRPARIKAWLRGPLSLTDTQLLAYDGTDPHLPIYLALNGTIYDVSVSPHFYGPGGSYHFFAGRDATRAYVTGCFDIDLTPDLRGVEEMFIPVEDDDEPLQAPRNGEAGGKGGKEGAKERKLRHEREKRLARQRVRDTIRGWERMFDGGKEGTYFKVGRVKREEGWDSEEKLGPRRELCRKAREGRPRREKGKG